MPTYIIETHYVHKGKSRYTINAPNIVALRKRVIKEWRKYHEHVSIYVPVKPGRENGNTYYYWDENGKKTGVAGKLVGYVDMQYRLPDIVWVTIDYSKGKRGLDAQSEWVLRENGTLGKKIR